MAQTETGPARPWTQPPEEVAASLGVEPGRGLASDEVRQRRERHGPNRLRSAQRRSAWQILVEQFKSLLVALLAVAGLVSIVFGQVVEGIAILGVILINAAIGFFTELRAVRSMEALQQMATVDAKVRRDGQVREVPAEEVVPGDVLVLGGGDVVTADARLVEASKLQADESALTGESMPVTKRVEPLEGETPLAERANMVFKGTAITRGAGEGIVVATGMDTELGHISSLVQEAEQESTPLEKRLNTLGQRLVWITLAIAAVVTLAGILVGKDILLMIETGIALAVATVPEGLPIVATIALARGMQRMARRNALINRLSAVETLGATNVICADKTGTLTENQMTVVEIALASGKVEVGGEGLETRGQFTRDDQALDPGEHELLRRALQVGLLCNNAELSPSLLEGDGDGQEGSAVGEPLEVALLVAGAKAGMRRDDLLRDLPEVREVAFDPDVKMMATFHRRNGGGPDEGGPDGGLRLAVKGAARAVLDASNRILTPNGERELPAGEIEDWLRTNERMAEEGLRVLALATRRVDSEDAAPFRDLTFLGLFGLLDPPREEVRPAIRACKEAGVRVVMVTGDHPATAKKIALAVGLAEDEEVAVVHGSDFPRAEDVTSLSEAQRRRVREAVILARVTPEQKLDLISIYQEAGQVVAMTGDGVNDAPALKKADIGVAMGQRGTQVAREASDMVLQDDRFSSIVAAIEQGRVIFGNIRKFVLYLLSCNMSEIAVISLASLVNAPLPIQPLQILYLNLVTDVFPALALGVGEGEAAVMSRPPRDPGEPVLTRHHWLAMGGYSLLITIGVLGAFALALEALGMDERQAVTVSFLTLAFGQLWHVFNMRSRDSGLFDNEIVENGWVWGALALCTALLFLAVYLPGLNSLLNVVEPGLAGWALVAGASLVPLAVGQALKVLGVGRTA